LRTLLLVDAQSNYFCVCVCVCVCVCWGKGLVILGQSSNIFSTQMQLKIL
jgi:hypothetical protein